MCSGANDDHFPLFFFVSPFPPSPSRRCPACPGCSVSCSQQRANSSGTLVGPRPQYPVEAKEARQRSLLCRSIGVWHSTAKTHTRSEHAAHLYGKGTQAGERPILHRVAKGKILLPLLHRSHGLALFCRHRRHLGMPPHIHFTESPMRQNAICDSDATARAAKREGMRAGAEAGRRINENSRHSGRDDDAEGGRHIRYFISRVSLCLRPPSPQQHKQ